MKQPVKVHREKVLLEREEQLNALIELKEIEQQLMAAQ